MEDAGRYQGKDESIMGWWPGKHLLQYVTQSEPFDRPAYAKAGPVAFCGLSAKTSGSDIIFSVYDSTSAAGTLLLPAGFTVPGTANLWVLSIPIILECH